MVIYDSAPVKPALNALIVEDSDDDAELLIYQLSRGGYALNYIRVETEEQMRRALLSQPWDIVISDYQLPTFSAPAALACLKTFSLDLPFIVVSGVIDEETSVNILSAGAHDFIVKGRWSRLIPAIQREVREARVRQARFQAEQNARIAAEQYRVIFETIGTPIMLIDHDLRTLLVNTPLQRLAGVETNELTGNRKWLRLLDQGELKKITTAYSSEFSTNKAGHVSFEVKINDKSGVHHVVIATIAAVPGTVNLIISLLDVTERKQAEETLRQSESLNRAVIDHSPLGISVRRPNGSPLQTNRVWDDMWQTDPQNANDPGKNYWDYLVENVPEFEADKANIQAVFKAGGELYFPELNVKAVYPYSINWISSHIYSLKNNENEVDRIVMLVEDISARKTTELALIQSEELFAKAFRSSPDGMLISQRASGVIIEVNQQWQRLFAYSRDESIGKDPRQLNLYNHYTDRQTLLDAIDENGSIKEIEIHFRKKTGEIILVDLSAEQVKINQIDCLLFTFKDITEIRRTEQALRESEDRYKVLFEKNPTIMVLFSPESLQIIDANSAACQFYGYSRDEFKNNTITQVTQRQIGEIKSLIGEILNNPEVHYQAKHLLATGSIRDVEVFSGPIQMGGTQYIISTVHDITERVAADETIRRRVDELAVLHSIALIGAEAIDEDALIERATQIISGKLYSDVTGILILDPTHKYLIPHRSYWGITQENRNIKLPIEACTSGQAIITGHPIRCGDVSTLSVYFEVNANTRSVLCVPIKSGNESIGVINIESSRINAYSEADEQITLTVAGQMATAIERIRTEKAVREQAQQLSIIYEVGQEIITAKMDAEQVYQSIHRAVSRMMPCEAFVIVRVDHKQKDLETVYAVDRGGRAPVIRLPNNTGVSGTVIRTGKSYRYEDFSKVDDFQNVVYFGDSVHTRSGCAVPLRLSGQIIGSLSTQSYTENAYTAKDLNLLELLAVYAAIALENFNLIYETHRQTLTLENMFDAVITANKDNLITEWNASAERLFGYTKEEAVGMSPARLFSIKDHDYQNFITEIYTSANNKSRWTGEIDFNHKKGQQGTAEIVVLVLYDNNKDINGTIFVFRDITQRKMAEKILKDSEEEFRSTFEQAAVGMAHTTLKGDFIKINQRFCDIIGYAQNDILGKNIAAITHPADITGNFSSMQQLVSGQIQTYTTEKRYIRKDGTPVWVQLTVNIARNTNGQPIYFIPVVEDISQRKQVESEILNLVSAVEQSDESIVITDLAGQITYANQALEAISGYRVSEVIGKKSSLFKSGSHDKTFYEGLWSTIKGGLPWKGTIINRKKNGSLYYEAATIFPVKDKSGEIINYAAVKRDITDQVERERSLQLIIDFSTALRKAFDINQILSLIFSHLTTIFQADRGFVYTLDLINQQPILTQGHSAWSDTDPVLLNLLSDINHKLTSDSPAVGDHSVQVINRYLPDDGLFLTTIPLMAQEITRGVVGLARKSALDEVELSFLNNFAEITGNSIHRFEMVQNAQLHANQLDTVSAMGRSLSAILNLPDIFPVITRAVKDLLPGSTAILITQYQAKFELITAIYSQIFGQNAPQESLGWLPLDPTGHELLSKTIITRLPVVYNLLSDPLNRETLLGPIQENTHSILLVPMQAKSQILGVIQIQSAVPNYFDNQKAELLGLIGNTAAIAIENARLFAETQEQIQHQTAINAIDTAIISSFDRKITLTVLVEEITKLFGIHAADILLLDPYTEYLTYEAGYGFLTAVISTTRLKSGDGISGNIAADRKKVYVPDLTQDSTSFYRSGLITSEKFTTYYGFPLIAKGKVKGILELFHRNDFTFDAEMAGILNTLTDQAAIVIDNADLFTSLQRTNIELSQAIDGTISGWPKALSWRENEDEDHSRQVADVTVDLARFMGLDEAQLDHVRRGALLHDIGKIGIPDSILLNEGPLTDAEWERMREHPKIANDILSPISFLQPTLDIPYNHHEKWDGTGYPRGLKGTAIPLAARIFAVIDVWDALLSDRRYRKAWPESLVIKYLEDNSGKHFDPQVVKAFLSRHYPEK